MEFMLVIVVWCGIHLFILSACYSVPRCEVSISVNHTTYCYWLILTQQDATSSKAKCKIDNGTLAYIPNEDALLKVTTLVTQQLPHLWTFTYVGYTRTPQGGIMVHGTNQVQPWVQWDTARGQPEFVGECVVLMTLTGKFHDARCYLDLYALCSTEINIEMTTDVSNAITDDVTPDVTTDVTTNNITCRCDCDTARTLFTYRIVNITKELQAKLDTLRKETQVNEELLSSTIRARTSASDPRPSSAYVGYLGIALLVVIFGGILLVDLPREYTTIRISTFVTPTIIEAQKDQPYGAVKVFAGFNDYLII